ncbi:unnamed protein product [Phaeothamnion confervicola]
MLSSRLRSAAFTALRATRRRPFPRRYSSMRPLHQKSFGPGLVVPPVQPRQLLLYNPARASSGASDEEVRRLLNDFNDRFVEARDEIEYAGESKETTYFDEEAAAAKEAVEATVASFNSVLAAAEESQRGEIMRSNGLKVEQLKAELEQLLHSDDH